MSGPRDDRIEAVFEEAARTPAAGRPALLDRLCAGDKELRAEVESLLAHAQETRDFLESPLLPGAAALAIPLPESIGPFRIIGVLGEGGMGCVYEAQQQRPNRSVAIKVVRSDAISPGALRRFDREIETLGQLRHPGIAQLYEVGQHIEAGRPQPYLVMELVRGLPLTKFAAAEKLTVAERIGLLADIADAVQYAHQRGVVHRDLKPENILVERGPDGRPAPKILDFGIARLTDGSADAPQHTLAGQPMGTLAYMSPEQFAADPAGIDTRCDVYALGVIAYELFAKSRPFDVTGMSVVQAAKMIESVEPPALGTIDRSLRGDVETIVARAMAKDRDRRYPTAAALADDLRRHLRDEPILARPPGAAYQFSKFARRNRALVIASGAAVLALVAGLMISTVLYVREQKARKHAAEEAELSAAVRDYMISGLLLSASPERMGYDVKMLDVLTKTSDGLHERFANQPAVEAAVRVDLGSVLGELGKFKESEAEMRMALPLLEQTVGKYDAKTIFAMNTLANLESNQQRLEESVATAQESLARATHALPPDHPQALSARNNLGAALQALGRLDEAVPILRKGLELAELHPQANENVLGTLLTQLSVCEHQLGHKEASLELTRRFVDHVRKYAGPNSAAAVVASNNLMNNLAEMGKLDEAATIAQDLPAAAERAYPPGHANRGYVYVSAGSSLMRVRRYEEAERLLLKSHDTFVTAYGESAWPTEQGMFTIRMLYFRWPGHAAQLVDWSVRSAAVRLMVANLTEQETTVKTLRELEARCVQAKADPGPGGLIGALWEQRDTIVPPGHKFRAAFLANLSLATPEFDRRDLGAPAAALAAAALPDATDHVDWATELVKTAQERAGR